MGAGCAQFLLHLLQDGLHLVEGDLFPVGVEDLDEAAHVGPLEVVGEVHIHIDPRHGMLEASVLVHHHDGIGDVLHPDLVDGDLAGVAATSARRAWGSDG